MLRSILLIFSPLSLLGGGRRVVTGEFLSDLIYRCKIVKITSFELV